MCHEHGFVSAADEDRLDAAQDLADAEAHAAEIEKYGPTCDDCHGYGTADGLPAGRRDSTSYTGWRVRVVGDCGTCGGTGCARVAA